MFHILTHASQDSKLAVPFCTAARAVQSGTIPGTLNILEVLLESRFNSLERLVALQVMFYHMTARVAAFWYALGAQTVILLRWPLDHFLTNHRPSLHRFCAGLCLHFPTTLCMVNSVCKSKRHCNHAQRWKHCKNMKSAQGLFRFIRVVEAMNAMCC